LKNHKYLDAITLAFFALSLVNIHFALLGVICMAIPFYLLQRDTKKTWCQNYCPRSSLYMTLGRKRKKKGKVTSMSFIKGRLKYVVLVYFGISLSIAVMSTVQVALGNMPPMLIPRFMIILPISSGFPQLITLTGIPVWITHLAFRMFSMMMNLPLMSFSPVFFYTDHLISVLKPLSQCLPLITCARKCWYYTGTVL